MLVDLGRNDIGRIAQNGSVEVTKIWKWNSSVMSCTLTSVVRGNYFPGLASIEALKATLPAGTVSGAPKIRAMKRIYEAEKEKRGVYAGAIGYLSVTGDLDFAIAIRTMILKNKEGLCAGRSGNRL